MMNSLNSIHKCVTWHKPMLNIITLVTNTIETTKITHMKICTRVFHITKKIHSQKCRNLISKQTQRNHKLNIYNALYFFGVFWNLNMKNEIPKLQIEDKPFKHKK